MWKLNRKTLTPVSAWSTVSSEQIPVRCKEANRKHTRAWDPGNHTSILPNMVHTLVVCKSWCLRRNHGWVIRTFFLNRCHLLVGDRYLTLLLDMTSSLVSNAHCGMGLFCCVSVASWQLHEWWCIWVCTCYVRRWLHEPEAQNIIPLNRHTLRSEVC